jgi:hypothetical protein
MSLVACARRAEAVDSFLFPSVAVGIRFFDRSILSHASRYAHSDWPKKRFREPPQLANRARNGSIATVMRERRVRHLFDASVFVNGHQLSNAGYFCRNRPASTLSIGRTVFIFISYSCSTVTTRMGMSS